MQSSTLILDGSLSEDLVVRAMHWANLAAELKKNDSGEWQVLCAEGLTQDAKSNFYKCLSDFKLRSIIDDQTLEMRKQIVRQALSNVFQAK